MHRENLHNQLPMSEALGIKGVYMFMHISMPFKLLRVKWKRGLGTDLKCQETRCLYNFGF